MEYLALITATIYDDNTGETDTVRTMCYATSFSRAAVWAEDYFGNTLETLHIELLDCIPVLNEEIFEYIKMYS